MEIEVKLFHQLRRYAPDDQTVFSFQLADNARVSDLLVQLNIPAAVSRTILVNGLRVKENTLLSPGDKVVLMSPLEGG